MKRNSTLFKRGESGRIWLPTSLAVALLAIVAFGVIAVTGLDHLWAGASHTTGYSMPLTCLPKGVVGSTVTCTVQIRNLDDQHGVSINSLTYTTKGVTNPIVGCASSLTATDGVKNPPPDVPGDDTTRCTFSFTLNATFCAGFQTVTVVGSGVDLDPIPLAAGGFGGLPVGGNASGAVFVNCPDVRVRKTGDTKVSVGERASFTITIDALGNSTATNVHLQDTLPGAKSWELKSGDIAACSITGVPATKLSCDYPSIAPLTSKVITVSTTTNACGTLTNQEARVSAAVDIDPSNNVAGPVAITVNCPDVHVKKSADPVKVTAPGQVSYTITAQNAGPGTANDVTVTDDLDDDLGVKSVTPSQGACDAVGAGNTISCNLGSIAAAGSATVTIVANVPVAACPKITNQAHVTASNEDPAQTGDNSSDPVSVAVNCPVSTSTPTSSPTSTPISTPCDDVSGLKDFGASHCADTSGTNGSVAPPVVTNTFELPDMVVEAKVAADNTPMQYIDPSTNNLDPPESAHRHDDGPTAKTARKMMVLPQPLNNPNQRQIEIWALVQSPVNDPNDIIGVHADVIGPGGSPLKVNDLKLTRRTCAELGNPAAAAAVYELTPLHAAVFTGQVALDKGLTGDTTINAAALDKYHRCTKNTLTAWSGIFKLGKSQAPGEYTVNTTATSAAGGLSPVHTEHFDVLQLLSFRMDFNAVAWGQIADGGHHYVAGNSTIDTFPSTTPTVENVGNVPVCLDLLFSPMAGKLVNNTHEIVIFDGSLNGSLEQAFLADEAGRFADPLAPNAPAQLTLSLTAPNPLNADTYQGRLDVSIKKTTGLTIACPPHGS